jgi:HAD superfamily hydrolase (TIGR01509 family)
MMPRDFRYELMDRMETALRQKFAAIDGVQELLALLERHGVPCAVGTNAGAVHTARRLETLGLSDYFNRRVYSFDHQTRPKPAPDIYLKAMAALPRRPEQCFIIDDSATGVRAGVAAGATVIGFTGGAHREAGYGDDLRAAGAAHAAACMDDVGRIIMGRLAAGAPRPLP